jgi:hypothetical protein
MAYILPLPDEYIHITTTPNTSIANGSSCTHPLYGMTMNTFISPPQSSPMESSGSEHVRLPHGPCDSLCWTVRPYTTPDHLAWSRTVRPLMLDHLGTHMQNTELHNMHHFCTYHCSTTPPPPTAYYNHVIPPHTHRTGCSSAIQEPKRYRARGVALIVHLTESRLEGGE